VAERLITSAAALAAAVSDVLSVQ